MEKNQNKIKKRGSGLWSLLKLGIAVSAIAVVALIFSEGCATMAIRPDLSKYQSPRSVKVVATGYCNCGQCCSWRFNWYGKPVHDGGKVDGKPKKIGITASGTRARMGTIAADTSVYPFGTIIEVPGYGYGRVEDRGGAIKGQKIDLWFSRHKDARVWGKKNVTVKVWFPK